VLGTHIGVPVYQHALPHEQQPCALDTARGALQYARSHGNDVLIIDTAGRLHVDAALMQELILLKETLVPVETLLVADALTGQTVVRIAEEFHAAVGISGVVLSKFDSDTRGGAALSLKSITGQPLLFVGTGERPQDFEPFHPERAAGRILGMGDIVSLVEKAQKAFDAQEHARAQKKTQSHERFTLSDMLDHLQTIEKMGPLHSLVEMIPGLAVAVSADALDARAFKRQKAIIQSMTVQERDNFLIIGPSRRRRIAAGSGTSVADVNRLIKNFERMRTLMRKTAWQSRRAHPKGDTPYGWPHR
ncbi:signal recognition particle protein, partial [Treponema pallidum]